MSIIAVSLVGSLYASSLNAWKRVVFTFPPEVQKVVANGTAVMEIEWRWLNETLEMIIKVNDEDILAESQSGDILGLLFDSDNNGALTGALGQNWTEGLEPYDIKTWNGDYGVFIGGMNNSEVYRRCYVYESWTWYNGSVYVPQYTCEFEKPEDHPDFIAYLNDSYYIYQEGEGYIYRLSIPKSLINVEPPTPIYISFMDYEVLWRYIDLWRDLLRENPNQPFIFQDTIAAVFTG